MTHASVFSGIGGPEVAAAMLGWENLFHCEINPFGRAVLDYWFPNSKSYEDITTTDFSEWRGRVNVLTGGFPCQPFSYAGKRGGAQDDRYLWPYMFRCIDQIRPDWVVAENVAGILSMVEQGQVSQVASEKTLFGESNDIRGQYVMRETFTIERICHDLERHGYSVQPVLIPALSVGAPHRRDRVFIIGHREDGISADTDSVGQLDGNKQERESVVRRSHLAQAERFFNEVVSNGEPRPTADRDGKGLEEWRNARRRTMETEGRAGTDNRTERPCDSRPSADTESEQGDGVRPEQSEDGRAQQVESGRGGGEDGGMRHAPHPDSHRGREVDKHMESEIANGTELINDGRKRNAADTDNDGYQTQSEGCGTESERENIATTKGCWREWPEWTDGLFRLPQCDSIGQRWANFPSVSPVHRGNDGFPYDVDDLTVSFGKWRTESLKAYGNAIVPQVMYEIFRAIEQVEQRINFE